VTHAANLEAFLIKYLGFSVRRLNSIYFKNASLSIFDFKKGKIKPIKITDYSRIKENLRTNLD